MNKQDDNWGAVKRFGLVAERFCTLVDAAATVDRTEFLVQVYRLLPELMAEAIRLPLIESDDDMDDDQLMSWKPLSAGARTDHEEWAQLYGALKEKLGDWNLYWQVFDPTTDKEAIYGSLADDIADIYRALKDGIRLMENGEAQAEDVIFAWRFNFYVHWGKHAIDALKTIHVLLEDTFTELNDSG
jgi:hypothetical protein